jgi:hypothetical protein
MVRKRSAARPVAIVVFLVGCFMAFARPAVATCFPGTCRSDFVSEPLSNTNARLVVKEKP